MSIDGHYVDGFLVAVPEGEQDAYIEVAKTFASAMKKHGMLTYVECWQDDVPEGKVNSFHTAVMRKDGEKIVFSFATWPDKATRDAGWAAMETDPVISEMTPDTMPWDGQRMIWGGFKPIVNL